MKKVSVVLSIALLLATTLSTFTLTTFADVSNIEANNNWFTGCFSYNIRKSATSSSDSIDVVTKGANRQSPTVYNDDYAYSKSNWISMKNDQKETGYARCDLICPKNRCYKVTASSGLKIRSATSTTASVVCTVPNGTYVQVISLVGGSDMSYVRVRTGSYEGTCGYVIDNSYLTIVNNVASNS